jgi:hypothetical protein
VAELNFTFLYNIKMVATIAFMENKFALHLSLRGQAIN